MSAHWDPDSCSLWSFNEPLWTIMIFFFFSSLYVVKNRTKNRLLRASWNRPSLRGSSILRILKIFSFIPLLVIFSSGTSWLKRFLRREAPGSAARLSEGLRGHKSTGIESVFADSCCFLQVFGRFSTFFFLFYKWTLLHHEALCRCNNKHRAPRALRAPEYLSSQ